ncbi:MAG: peptidase sortase [Candidatus Peribacteria bacterium]|nr:peptidase sortase [Candidatus Peribacteria bacterium]
MNRSRVFAGAAMTLLLAAASFIASATAWQETSSTPQPVSVSGSTAGISPGMAQTFQSSDIQAGFPIRLRIRNIHVDAAVEQVGTNENQEMQTPTEWNNVGWYAPGPRPGQQGTAVMAGHLDSKTGKAVFWDLQKLKPGDTVDVVDSAGHTLTFTVKHKETYTDTTAPMQKIFGQTDGIHLNLITCGGTWNKTAGRYEEKLVVYTELAPD